MQTECKDEVLKAALSPLTSALDVMDLTEDYDGGCVLEVRVKHIAFPFWDEFLKREGLRINRLLIRIHTLEQPKIP